MKKILIASIISISLHGAFLFTNFGFIKDSSITQPKLRSISVTMEYRQPKQAGVPDKKPVIKKKNKTEKKPEIKPVRKRKKVKHEPVKTVAKSIPSDPQPVIKHIEEEPSEEEPEPSENQKEIEVSDIAAKTGRTKSHGDNVSNVSVTNASPLYRKNPPPIYPRAARRRGLQGTVILEILVAGTGRVKDMKIAESSGFTVLDKAAVSSVKKWLFEPGRKGEEKIEMWVKVPVCFKLK